MGPIRTMVGVALVAVATAAEAQRSSQTSIALTPYFGLVSPGRELLLRPGLDPLRDPESQALFGVAGGRLTVGLSEKLGVEADVGFGKSGLQVSKLSAPSGTNAKVTTISGRLVYRTKPTTEPSSVTLHAGLASVSRRFTEKSGGPSSVKNRSNLGAVLGATIGFRMTARTALMISAEDYVYNASFEVTGPGGALQRTQSLTQNDIRVTVGVRFALFGQ